MSADEELAEHTKKYLEIQDSIPLDEEDEEIDSRFISDDLLIFTADWYRNKYPNFPDHFYEIFELFSNELKYDDNAEDVATEL
jgi:hypothetical protein